MKTGSGMSISLLQVGRGAGGENSSAPVRPSPWPRREPLPARCAHSGPCKLMISRLAGSSALYLRRASRPWDSLGHPHVTKAHRAFARPLGPPRRSPQRRHLSCDCARAVVRSDRIRLRGGASGGGVTEAAFTGGNTGTSACSAGTICWGEALGTLEALYA